MTTARRTLPILGLVACLFTIAGAALLLPHLLATEPARPPHGRPALGSWNQTHQIDLPPGWRVAARNVGLDEESTSLDGPDDQGCLVIVFPGEVGPRMRSVRTQRVLVAGAPGVYGPLDPDFGPYSFAVSWPYAEGRWAQVRCDLDRNFLVEMAERVRFAPNSVLVPFRLAGVPEAFGLTELITDERMGKISTEIYLRQGDDINAATMWIGNQPDTTLIDPSAGVEHLTVRGHLVELRARTQSLCFPTRSDPICISIASGEPADGWSNSDRQLALRTAELVIPVENPRDRSTWIDADEALPR